VAGMTSNSRVYVQFDLANSFLAFAGSYAISFPEHARSQVKGGHSSGEIELIQACDWLTADSCKCLEFLVENLILFTLKSIENN
jgi:hypothetical protein